MLQKVVRSTIIDAPIERVWAVIRDFNSHDQWHDVVDQSAIESGLRSDQVGCVRNFTLKDGNHIREQLLTLDDKTHRSTYCIVEATVPLQRYVATVTLKPVTDGNRTFWHWESTFATPPGQERELRNMVAQGVYEAGFENLRRHLRSGGDLHGGRGELRAALAGAAPMPTRQIVLDAYGEPSNLVPRDAQAPGPQTGEVRIRQRAIGINYLDVYLRRGEIPGMLPLPGVLGMEAAGTVIDVGDKVGGLLPGDRVAYLYGMPGAYCTVRTVPADRCVRLPAQIEDDQAAALLLKGITADYLLRDLGRIGRGTRLLVHAAAGGVGLVLCAWAKALGARVIGTVSTEAKARVAREHGCDQVIVTSNYQFADAVRHHFGDGADVIVDGLGAAAQAENLAALAPCGHWISLGNASGHVHEIDANALLHKSASFSRPVAFAYVPTQALLAERAQRVWDALAQGFIKAPSIERYTLDAASRAHERLQSRSTIGSLLLTA